MNQVLYEAATAAILSIEAALVVDVNSVMTAGARAN